ncbi:MAG: ParB/RepB/Spo0J family partition protein [Clostridiales bacterium]|nr:ParB/RepB/Spo0J family partition protein [Clostridiales bacterium]
MAKRSGLGKGLDTLIPVNTAVKAKEKVVEKIVEKVIEKPIEAKLKLTEIEPNKSQPRKNFDEESLMELADSIKQFGIIQPIVVQKRNGYYEIIAGERRWRAAKLAKIKEVPVIIKEYSDEEIMEIALIENIQREELNPIEEAIAYKRLLQEFNLKQEEVAEKVSKSRTAITNSMRLLKLSDEVQNMVITEEISSGHARTLLAIEDKDKQLELAKKIAEEKLSVRETEKLVKQVLNPKEKPERVKYNDEFVYKALEADMKTKIGSNVTINRRSKEKGKIEIEYFSTAELERIAELINKLK